MSAWIRIFSKPCAAFPLCLALHRWQDKQRQKCIKVAKDNLTAGHSVVIGKLLLSLPLLLGHYWQEGKRQHKRQHRNKSVLDRNSQRIQNPHPLHILYLSSESVSPQRRCEGFESFSRSSPSPFPPNGIITDTNEFRVWYRIQSPAPSSPESHLQISCADSKNPPSPRGLRILLVSSFGLKGMKTRRRFGGSFGFDIHA